MVGAVTVLEEKEREEQKRNRSRDWGERTGVRKKREKRGEEGRRSVQRSLYYLSAKARGETATPNQTEGTTTKSTLCADGLVYSNHCCLLSFKLSGTLGCPTFPSSRVSILSPALPLCSNEDSLSPAHSLQAAP